ncbi:MetQ/NlpA family ABC transporter substrate-binding protein [Neisseriaceae bacterium CLB008]
MIKPLAPLFALALALGLAACSHQDSATSAKAGVAKAADSHIVLGATGADADIWRFIATTPAAKAAGLTIEVKDITDGITLNTATAEQQLDVNAFQSWAYLKTFNKNHGDSLRALATTYLEPMGLYSNQHQSLATLPEGALISIPNDAANTARALLLLAQAGLITLSPQFDPVMGTPQDIVDNPKHLTFKLVQGASGPRILRDVDLAAISNTFALEGGLNVVKDALIHEQANGSNHNNVNLLVTSKSRIDDVNLNQLGKLYHQPSVQAYIKEHFGGTKLAVTQPVSSLN